MCLTGLNDGGDDARLVRFGEAEIGELAAAQIQVERIADFDQRFYAACLTVLEVPFEVDYDGQDGAVFEPDQQALVRWPVDDAFDLGTVDDPALEHLSPDRDEDQIAVRCQRKWELPPLVDASHQVVTCREC